MFQMGPGGAGSQGRDAHKKKKKEEERGNAKQPWSHD